MKGKGHCELSILADQLRNDPVAFAMCIISNHEAIFNLIGDWYCPGDDHPICPDCQSLMQYRDCRQRHIRKQGGGKHWGRVRRYLCKHCHRLHTELPTNLSPYKHYDAEIIGDVIEDVVSSDDEGFENYPCAVTMERWKLWIEHNHSFIEGYIRSIGFRLLDLGERFLKTTQSVLDQIQGEYNDEGIPWLTVVNRLIYNTGASLEPWPPFYAYAP